VHFLDESKAKGGHLKGLTTWKLWEDKSQLRDRKGANGAPQMKAIEGERDIARFTASGKQKGG